MGAYQSKLPANLAPREKAVIDRLLALELENSKQSSDDGYVHIGDSASNEKGAAGSTDISKTRKPEAVSVTLMEVWQAALLEDPKNR